MKLIFVVLTFVAVLQAGAQTEGDTVFGATSTDGVVPGPESAEDPFLLGLQLQGLSDVSSFVDLLSASNMEAIDITQPNTVFVPNNQGFDDYFSVGKRNYDDLKNNRPTLLGLILRYHVVSGNALEANDLENEQILETLAEQSLEVLKEEEKVTIVGTRTEGEVVQADIRIGETVVHIVDAVLLPDVTSKKKDNK